MKVSKKISSMVMAFFFVLFCSVCFAGCSDGKNDGKYDVSIRLTSDFGTWEFTPDIDEIKVEREYDWEQHKINVDSYKINDGREIWLAPQGDSTGKFRVNFGKIGQKYDEEEPKYIYDRGEYYYFVSATCPRDLWNSREVKLYITII